MIGGEVREMQERQIDYGLRGGPGKKRPRPPSVHMEKKKKGERSRLQTNLNVRAPRDHHVRNPFSSSRAG